MGLHTFPEPGDPLDPAGKTLVAVAAHADDAELNAGGLMVRWAAEGGSVHIVMITANGAGALLEGGQPSGKTFFLGPDQTTAIRHREQDAAAALIGARVHYLNYPQRYYWDGRKKVFLGYTAAQETPACMLQRLPAVLMPENLEERTKVGDLLVTLQPDLVVTHSPLDVDPEHFAVVAAVVKIFKGGHALRLAATRLWAWAPGGSHPAGVIKLPFDRIVDISAHFDTKMGMLACHASQMTVERWERTRARAGFYGARCGVRYAEPFVAFNRGGEFQSSC